LLIHQPAAPHDPFSDSRSKFTASHFKDTTKYFKKFERFVTSQRIELQAGEVYRLGKFPMKRNLSAHQKQMRLMTVMLVALALALFVGLLYLFNR
jgi:hypothetical protein